MVFCPELKKHFADKSILFTELKKNRDTIIANKKSDPKKTDWLSLDLNEKKEESKEETNGSKILKIGDYVYPVINTTNYLDSHGDVHIDGIWNDSVAEQKNKIYYVINHCLEIGKIISYPDDTEVLVRKLAWTDLGRDYEGETEALIFKVLLTEIGNKDAINAIIAGKKVQNSVRMRYVRIRLCINDTNEDFKEEYSSWLQYYPAVVNKEKANETGYFWAVLEADIYKEGSMVPFGSNDVTPVLTEIPENGEDKSINPDAPSDEPKTISKFYDLI